MLHLGLKVSAMALLLILSACSVTTPAAAPSVAPAAPTANAIAGTWEGVVNIVDALDTLEIEVSIPKGCAPGDICGTTINKTSNCTFEFTFESIQNNVYHFTMLRSLTDDCPTLPTAVSYTLQPDGKLYRKVETPEWSGEATLTRK